MLTPEEFRRFDRLFEEVLEPFFKERHPEIIKVIEKDQDLKRNIEEELKKIEKEK